MHIGRQLLVPGLILFNNTKRLCDFEELFYTIDQRTLLSYLAIGLYLHADITTFSVWIILSIIASDTDEVQPARTEEGDAEFKLPVLEPKTAQAAVEKKLTPESQTNAAAAEEKMNPKLSPAESLKAVPPLPYKGLCSVGLLDHTICSSK